jgi:ParB family chromosome partitioning protein
MSRVVLGKGLEALIPGEGKAAGDEKKYRMVPLERLSPNPMQPRRDFDETRLSELADSFKRDGIIQPLVVRREGSGYTIIAGERRFRAARIADLKEVPVLVMDDVDDVHMLELALVENLQREDLNPIEAAEGNHVLIEKCGLTQAQLAARIGKSRTTVTNLLRLLTLPDAIKEMVRAGKLTEGHARAILAFDDEAEQLRLAERIVSDALTVRDVENRAGRSRKRRLVPKRKNPAVAEAESFLRQLLGTSVKIHRGLKRGRIEIEYYSDDDLDRLLELFRKAAG